MPTGNFEPEAALPVPEPAPRRGFRLPADYYSAPLAEVRPIFPKWVPYGCGIAAAAFLVLLFISGALLNGPAIGQGFDFIIGMTLGELRPMLTKDVTSEQKDAFELEVKALREGLRTNRVEISRVQPFLQTMQKVIGDKKVTPGELGQLTEAAKTASKPTK
jgi:hypothetical protein